MSVRKIIRTIPGAQMSEGAMKNMTRDEAKSFAKELRESGATYETIATQLSENGFKTKAGTAPSSMTVYQLVNKKKRKRKSRAKTVAVIPNYPKTADKVKVEILSADSTLAVMQAINATAISANQKALILNVIMNEYNKGKFREATK